LGCFDRIEAAMTDLEAGQITAVMKVTPVAAWLVAKRPALRIVAQVPTTRNRSESGLERMSRFWWRP
jgi:ABC-type amino acid transport substrate-binding protein